MSAGALLSLFLAAALLVACARLTPRSDPGEAGHQPPSDFPAPLRWLAWLSRMLAVLEGVCICVCLVALVALIFLQFASRNVRVGWRQAWMPATPDWVDGVVRHSVFLLGYIGAGYATFTARHIRIDAVTRLASPRLRMALRIVTTIGALAICVLLTYASYDFYVATKEEVDEATQRGQLFNSMRGAMLMISGFVLVAFHFLVQVALDIAWVVTGRQPPASWIAEASHGEAAVPDAAAGKSHSLPSGGGEGEARAERGAP